MKIRELEEEEEEEERKRVYIKRRQPKYINRKQ